jgi:uncharacterized protein (DUF608 family)
MFGVSALILLMTVSQQPGTFTAPGLVFPAAGVWYSGGNASSAMPLGSLGTGYVDFTAGATFGESTAENNWLKPSQVPAGCGFSIQFGDKKVDLFPGSKTPESLKFWGHYPAADVDFGSSFGDDAVFMRAFAPFVPRAYATSSQPAALFHFYVMNRSASSKAVEIALQWQAAADAKSETPSGIENILGWRRDVLLPGKSWKPAPIFAFGRTRNDLIGTLKTAVISLDSLQGATAPEGQSYASGVVQDFLLQELGGFDSKANGRLSGAVDGASSISHLFWNVSYGGKRAGFGADGAYGLKSSALPARTEGGELEVRLRVADAGPNAVALAFTIMNVSGDTLRDLRFGLAVNAEVGGPGEAGNLDGAFSADLNAAVVENKKTGLTFGIGGSPDDCIVGSWPKERAAELNDEWIPQGAEPIAPATKISANANQLTLTNGTYAVGGAGDPRWILKNEPQQNGIIRARAIRTLAPNETAEVTMGLSWHFPTWESSDGEKLRHRYATDQADAASVLADVLPRAGEIEKKILKWQDRVFGSPSTPPFLKDAIINGLYVIPRNSWWMDDGRFFQSESFTGCPITETFVCRFYGTFPLAMLFPECERSTMYSIAAAQAPTGEIPFAFGQPAGSRSPYYHVQHPIVSPEFVLVTWRNYTLWKDQKYLDDMYPRCQAALRFSMTMDKNQDGIVDEDPGNEKGFPANQYYDVWPWWGTSAYTGGIWLAALRAGEEMAKIKGDVAFQEETHKWFDIASTSYFKKLWTGSHYRLYNDPENKRVSDTCLTNALCGQWFAYATGLGDIVPRATIQTTVDTTLRRNAAITKFGAINGVRTDGTPDMTFPDHSAVITIGEVWSFCAMAAFSGRAEDAMRLFISSYENILLEQRTPWNIPWCLDRDTGAIKWGINYYSNPCVWTLFQALDPATYAKLAEPVL